MTLSPRKLKTKDIESYEHANRYWDTEVQTCKKAKGWLSKRVIHPKLKMDNTRSQKLAYEYWNALWWMEVTKTAQCSWHTFSLVILCWSSFYSLFFWKTYIGYLFLKDMIIHATSSCLLFDSTTWQFWMTIVDPFDI